MVMPITVSDSSQWNDQYYSLDNGDEVYSINLGLDYDGMYLSNSMEILTMTVMVGDTLDGCPFGVEFVSDSE